MTKSKNPKWYSKESNTAFNRENRENTLKGCFILLAVGIIILICLLTNDPYFFSKN